VRADLVRVELATPDAMESEAERTACEAVLSAPERERAGRIRDASARDHFVLAHALARTALARAAAVDPGRIALRIGPRGKPEIDAPPEARPFRFNLSHTDGLAACAIARSAAVGVDVEARDRSVDPLPLAARFFAPAETAVLRALGDEPRRQRFLAVWTLKEALLKAIGVGIAGGLARVAFDLDAEPPRLLAGGVAGDPARWQLLVLAPTPRHLLALAVERGAGADYAVDVALRARLSAPS
jgi:4'-phosphopantetheinyl transferase